MIVAGASAIVGGLTVGILLAPHGLWLAVLAAPAGGGLGALLGGLVLAGLRGRD